MRTKTSWHHTAAKWLAAPSQSWIRLTLIEVTPANFLGLELTCQGDTRAFLTSATLNYSLQRRPGSGLRTKIINT